MISLLEDIRISVKCTCRLAERLLDMPGPLSSSDYGTPYELIDWCFNILDIKTFSPFSCQENLSGIIIDLKCVQPKVAQPVW